MNAARSISPNGGEEVPCSQPGESVLHLPSVLGEKYRARAGTIADSEDVALLKSSATSLRGERVIMRLVTIGVICHGMSTESWQTEGRVGLCG